MNTVNYDLLNALIILGIVACIIFILAMIYLIFVFSRINILAKKTDYLVEDVTYKSEKLNVTIDAIVKLSNYINILDTYFNNSNDEIINYVKNKITSFLEPNSKYKSHSKNISSTNKKTKQFNDFDSIGNK